MKINIPGSYMTPGKAGGLLDEHLKVADTG